MRARRGSGIPLHRLPFTTLTCLALTLGATGASALAQNWEIMVVDSQGDVGWWTSLAVDGSGNPHISYSDETNNDLKYAYEDMTGWHIQTVDSEGNVGWYSSLALDDTGYPHVSYFDGTNSALKYGYEDAAGWHLYTVDSDGYVGRHTSLALDNSGYPHISYCLTDPTMDYYPVKYAHEDAAGWHVQVVDPDGHLGYFTSLALDDVGYPHISYYNEWPDGLKYAYHDAEGWHLQSVESEGNVGRYTSLALDNSGYPHISYLDDTSGDLKYAYRHGHSGWSLQTLDSQGNVGSYTSLALDNSDYSRISYFDDTNGDLKYAYEDPTGWHIQTVDSEGDVGYWTSLALDDSGYPHVSYFDWGSSDLKYARFVPIGGESFVPEPTTFDLVSVSPNPFRVSSVVSYSLSRPGAFQLEAYDVLGRKVATLANGLAERGAQRLTWTPVGVPPGAYLLRLSRDGGTGATQRVIHVR